MQNTAAIMRYIERPFSSPYLVFVIRRGFLVNDTLRHIEDIREIYGTSTREFQKPLKVKDLFSTIYLRVIYLI